MINVQKGKGEVSQYMISGLGRAMTGSVGHWPLLGYPSW